MHLTMTEQHIAPDTDSSFAAADFYPRFFTPYYFLAIAALFTHRRRPMIMTALDKWYDYLQSHDRAALWDLLHPDVVFESPVVHTPQRGRDVTFKYLSSAEKVLGGPGFAYVGQWRGNTSAVLEFENEIDRIKINGVDMITFGDDGRITHFKVMVRPLKAVNLLHRLMGEQLARQ
jgi:SnoaL-like domain